MRRGSGTCWRRPGAWPAQPLARCASMSQPTTAQQRYRQTERGKQLHQESEQRRRARLRGEDVSPRQQNGEKTHCGACGLPYDEQNTAYAADGSRRCKNCHNSQVKAAYAADPETGRQRSRDKHQRHGAGYAKTRRDKRAADPEQVRKADRDRYQANPETKRAGIYRRRHNLQPGELESIWASQGGCCYLCGNPLPDPGDGLRENSGSWGLPHMDHDHRHCPPGRSCPVCRRGLACPNCNIIVGHARDNPELLRLIADNLELVTRIVTERLSEEESCKILAIWQKIRFGPLARKQVT